MKNLLPLILFMFSFTAVAEEALTAKTAEQRVRKSICLNDLSVEQMLEKKIKKRSQRDLGWRVFEEDIGFDVERAILVNKSLQIRYRWNINPENIIIPVSKRAKRLCPTE